jgi:endonuclease/exonuclease/phosphatase family metal-dependent hydrolase
MKQLFAIVLVVISLTAQAQSIKVMTYNIRYDNKNDGDNIWNNRKAKVAKIIEFYAPAVFGTQEGLVHQLDYLDESLKSYKYIGVGRDDGKKKGEFSAIFYNSTDYDIVENSDFWLSETPEKVSVGWDASMERICSYALFKHKKSGKTFWVFNAHFDHRGVEARKQSAQLILDMIDKKTSNMKLPVVLMGDLNLGPEEEPIKIISSKMDDARLVSETEPYGPPGTFNRFDKDFIMNRRIDYIFTKNFKVKKYAQIADRLDNNNYPSDHIPVLTELAF